AQKMQSAIESTVAERRARWSEWERDRGGLMPPVIADDDAAAATAVVVDLDARGRRAGALLAAAVAHVHVTARVIAHHDAGGRRIRVDHHAAAELPVCRRDAAGARDEGREQDELENVAGEVTHAGS